MVPVGACQDQNDKADGNIEGQNLFFDCKFQINVGPFCKDILPHHHITKDRKSPTGHKSCPWPLVFYDLIEKL